MNEEAGGGWASSLAGYLDPGSEGPLEKFIRLRVRHKKEDKRRIGCIFCFECDIYLNGR